jgi:hypothetical protein
MTPIRLLAAFSLSGLVTCAAIDAQASTVLCESRDGSHKYCPVDTRGGVRLSRQLSTQGCWQNDTWGYDANQIWVSRGCRAEFQVGGESPSSAGKGSAVAAAAVVGIAAAAIIASKHDDDHHKNKNKYDRRYDPYYDGAYDRTYDNRYDNRHDSRYDDRYRESTRYGYNGYGGDPRWTFNCESRGDRRNYCDVPRRGHVEVYKQRSLSPCTYGRSWGMDGHTVWVKDGCRAEFAVY